MGCVLEIMVGKLWVGEQAGGQSVQEDQLNELIKLGFFYYSNKKNKEAIKYFKQALKVSQRADLYNNLGLVYLGSEEHAKAVHCFKKSLNLDMGYVPALYNLGVAMYYAKAYENAVKVFDNIAKVKDLDKAMLSNALNDRGCAQNRNGDLEAAEKSFEAAQVLDDKFVRPYVNLGNLYCNKGRFDDAKVKYEKALKLDENCAAAYNGLGVVALEEGDLNKAQESFDKAFAVDQNCSAAYVNRMILKKNAQQQNADKK